jgi:hypothetical protein
VYGSFLSRSISGESGKRSTVWTRRMDIKFEELTEATTQIIEYPKGKKIPLIPFMTRMIW